jgi:transcriptional regulator of arginine metabolism
MKSKQERLHEIRKIINTNKIHRQEELLSLLVNRGFDTTQATLSRDLRELRVGKIHDLHYGSIYFIPDEVKLLDGELKPPLQGIVSLEFSHHMAVLKTLPGFANSVAVKIDEASVPVIIGTISGNDSILMIFKENLDREEVLNILMGTFPEFKTILVE